MITTLGLLELNSIVRGYEAADAMLKAAEVSFVKAHSICPGKFMIMISGDVGAVETSVKAGKTVGKEAVVDSIVIANLHNSVIPAITGTSFVGETGALGVLEFFNVASAVIAADKAVKTADVKLIEIRLGFAVGGKAFITLTGDVSAVNSAVDAAGELASEIGMLVGKTVIPRPHESLIHSVL